MTITPTALLNLPIIATGTESGTWGDVVDNGLTSYLDIAIAGGLAITVTTADVTLTNTTGTSSATNLGATSAQYAILNISGAMTAARNLILPGTSKTYVINNNTTGGFTLTVKSASTSGIGLVNGEKAVVAWNGADYVKVANQGGSISFADASTQNTAATGFGFKNRIINGAMVIDQRNAGAAVTVNIAAGFYSADRFRLSGTNSSGIFTAEQSTDVPTGFYNSLKLTVTTADASIAASDLYYATQFIEGNNVSDLGFGTAGASSVTLSFWVKSSVTGNYGGALSNSAVDRSYPFTYAINSANTWEQKTVTVAGDTTGTWLKTTGIGLRVYFGLGIGSTFSGTANAWAAAQYLSTTGSTNWISTNAATFYITGVQLEKGSTATSFDYRPYGTELALCQRYFEVIGVAGNGDIVIGSIATAASQTAYISYPFAVSKRASPTVTTNGTWAVSNAVQPVSTQPSTWGFRAYCLSVASGVFYVQNANTNTNFTASAEL